jgi:hypothetical protein
VKFDLNNWNDLSPESGERACRLLPHDTTGLDGVGIDAMRARYTEHRAAEYDCQSQRLQR